MATLAAAPYGNPDISPQTNPISSAAWATEIALLILYGPAYTAQVFLRRKFGCRYLRLWMILACDLLLCTVFSYGAYGSSSLGFRPTPTRLFAAIMTIFAVYHSKGAWNEFWGAAGHPDKLWHSLSDGISVLHSILPKSLVSDWVMRILIEPIVVALCGLLCLWLSVGESAGYFRSRFLGLGVWLLMSALFYAVLEAMLYEQRLHKFIDMVDQNIEAASMQEVQASYLQGSPQQPTPEQLMGNPVIYNPNLFKVMQTARTRANSARQKSAAAS